MINLDLATIIFQIINFLVMVALLYWFLLKPVLAKVTARAAEKDRLLHETEQERERATATRLQLEERLDRAEEEAAEIISLAQEKIEVSQKALLQEAYEEAKRIRQESHEDVHRFQQQVMSQSYDRVLETIIELSGAAIAAVGLEELHDNLVKRLNDSILGLGQRDMARVEDLRRSLGDRMPAVEINISRPLTPTQQGLLANTLAALADRRVSMEVKLDPSLVAGIKLRIGDLVIDSSIAGDLAACRDNVAASLKKELRGG